MEKLLLAVDGSGCSARAVRWTIDAVRAMKTPAALHVVTVQPTIASGEVRRFVGSDTIENYQREEGDKALAAARAQFDAEKVAYQPHILVGHVAQAITDFSTQNGCTSIVMGTRGLGGVTGLVLGSVASQVIHLATVPVTLIK